MWPTGVGIIHCGKMRYEGDSRDFRGDGALGQLADGGVPAALNEMRGEITSQLLRRTTLEGMCSQVVRATPEPGIALPRPASLWAPSAWKTSSWPRWERPSGPFELDSDDPAGQGATPALVGFSASGRPGRFGLSGHVRG